MPRTRTIEPFLLVLVDDETRRFTVVGPMTDDTSWNTQVCRAQDAGIQVRCFTPSSAQTRQQVIANVQRELGLVYTDEIFL